MKTEHTQAGRHSFQSSYRCFWTSVAIPIGEKLPLLQDIMKMSTKPVKSDEEFIIHGNKALVDHNHGEELVFNQRLN